MKKLRKFNKIVTSAKIERYFRSLSSYNILCTRIQGEFSTQEQFLLLDIITFFPDLQSDCNLALLDL